MKILVLNSGSSSQKARLYELQPPVPDDPAAFTSRLNRLVVRGLAATQP